VVGSSLAVTTDDLAKFVIPCDWSMSLAYVASD